MKTIKAIVVDDEIRIRRGIERLILKNTDNWEIVSVYDDGQAAYDDITNNGVSFDVLFTDVQMPVMNGLTLVSKLKEDQREFMPVIISGFDEFSYVQNAIRSGAVDYILKPIDRAAFKEQLTKLEEQIIILRSEEKNRKSLQMDSLHQKRLNLLKDLFYLKEYDESANINDEFEEAVYQLISISPDLKLPKDHLNKLFERILNGAKEQLPEHSYWIWRYQDYYTWLLVKSEEKNHVISFLRKLQHRVRETEGYTISAAISLSFSDLSVIPFEKEELLAALQLRMFNEGNYIIYPEVWKEMMEKEGQSVSNRIYQLSDEIVRGFKIDITEVRSPLERYLEELKKTKSPQLIKEAVQYLSIRLINEVMVEEGVSSISGIDAVVGMSDDVFSFDELKTELERWITQLSKDRKERFKQETDPIILAKEWIQSNLAESITIKQIAAYIHMNPTYFCELFKSETGVTVLDYITKERMQLAKELLKTTDLKIYEVAEEAGYTDTKYFSRLFKQHIGKLPSAYRSS
ncbi:helix-turn-helix domain-containing protein [Jeotgalibacillus malaysiensis]|uniref:response regulator transcription factor n=1 Tax=Jeotgalibacillus malaysiensis TaxID=1508404 RepID=UPI00384BF089